ncbi:hypothetical protein GCM10027093_04410 [Paraburkholderia jirisanensis]
MLTYSIQKVGYDYQQLDAQGETDFTSFIAAFEAFPWGEQYREWNETQDGPLPALVLQYKEDGRELWVSALSNDLTRDFQLNSVSMRTKKGLFGIGKETQQQHVETFDIRLRDDVDALCLAFCQRQFEEVDRLARWYVENDLENDRTE